MSFVDRVLSLVNEKGITRSKMLHDLDLNKTSFLNWQERGTIPGGDTLLKIADYFGVTVDYLLGKEEKNEMSPQNPTERKLILLARKTEDMPEAQREALLKYFEETIDVYLKTRGIDKTKGD